MRVAILADIHGNLPALNAVLDHAAQQNVDTFWCLGDVVGYGPWPVQCWSALQQLGIATNGWVVGNHDLGLVKGLCGGEFFTGEYFDEEAKTILDYHRQICSTSYPQIFTQIEQLKAITEPRPGVILAHGVPRPNDVTWTVTKYTTGKVDAEHAVADLMKAGMLPQLIAVGHSHQALFWQRISGDEESDFEWQVKNPQGEISLGDLRQTIVYLNPGSVGQSRDEGLAAGYCIIDWEQMTVSFERVNYALELTRQKMMDLGYPQSLINKWYSN